MKTPQLYFYLGAMLCLAACSDSVDPISPCADFCADAIHLYRCDASTGKTTLEKCTNGCHEGKCLEAPIVAPTKCTRDTCISDTTLLACNTETGEYTKTPCQFGCRADACSSTPIETCTKNTCKDATTLLVCDTNAGTQTEKVCPSGCENGACKGDPVKCTQHVCRDATTLLVCDIDTGTQTERVCPSGCENGACKSNDFGVPCVKDACKDAVTLYACDKTTMTTREEPCPYYCYQGACVPKPVPCKYGALPRCEGSDKLVFCDNLDGENDYEYTAHCAPGRTCKTIDGAGACVVDDAIANGACIANACKDLNTLVVCNDGKPTEQSCGQHAYCIDDKCQPRYTTCQSNDDCAQLDMTCVDGRCAPATTACASNVDCPGSGELCIDKVCVQRNEIAVCTKNDDCKSDELCRHGLCYLKSNMELKVGDSCDWGTFQEYCDDTGNIEIKCGYEKTVEKNDCASMGGCAVYVKAAYRTNKPVRNAICRGEEERLRECKKPGVTSYQCVNVLDLYFSYFMSVAEACTIATDGTMIHLYQRDQYTCNAMCNENTGLCPNATYDCPSGQCSCTKNTCKDTSTLNVCNEDGSITEKVCPSGCVDGKCAPPDAILGKSCPTESDAFCHDQSVVYCAEQSLTSTVGIWTSYTCPTGFMCIDQENESVCAEECTTLGSESSVCATTSIGSLMLKTVCTQLGDKRVYIRDVNSMTSCENGCTDDNKSCK